MKVFLSGILILSVFFLTGCGKPTYPKDKLAESVENLCREEYNTEVSAKVVGQTLGIHLVLDRLLGSLYGSLSFEDKASEILEHVMMSIRRVILSSDADVKFFTLIGTDQATGLEITITHYSEDVRRVMLMNISRNDYFQRIRYQLRPSITLLGRKRVYQFFNNMGKESIEKIIQRNFVDNVTVKDISPTFFLSLLELGMKENARYRILELREKPIAQDKTFYYAKVRETYSLKEGLTPTSLSVPSNFVQEYLIAVTIKNYTALIERIYPLATVNKEKKRVLVPLPEELTELGDPTAWKSRDFYLEDAQLPDFIAYQVALRIRNALTQKKDQLEQPFLVENVEATYVEDESMVVPEGLPKRSIFELIFTLKKQATGSTEEKKLSKPLLEVSLKELETICKNYKFSNFSGIRVSDSEKTEILNIDKSMFKTLLGK